MHFSCQKLDFLAEMKVFITARKRSWRRLCFYMCLSVHGGVPGQVPPWAGTPPGRYTPPAGTPPPQCMLGYGQQAGGRHPTEMHSCFSGLLQCPPPAPDPRERVKREAHGRCWTGRNLSAGTHSRQGLFC